jgi:ABC-2 type transport system permease protein
MIASALVNTGFQQIAIFIPVERDLGALKRLRGTPMPAASYFIGKAIVVTVSMIIQVLLLLAAGVAFFGVNLPTEVSKWGLFAEIFYRDADSAKSHQSGTAVQIR